jgi:predicted nucleic acid-binding protein
VKAGLADTSLFIAREADRPLSSNAVPAMLTVSVITVAELRAGVLAAQDAMTRSQRLRTFEFVLGFEWLPVDGAVAEAWATLRVALRDARRRMGVNDAWIAATAMAHDLPVVTQDDGFAAAADLGLRVIRV